MEEQGGKRILGAIRVSFCLVFAQKQREKW
jgi:hypothetical protein